MDFTNLTKTDKSGKINLQTILPEETDNAILPNLLSRHRFINFSKVCGNNPVVFSDTERASKRQGWDFLIFSGKVNFYRFIDLCRQRYIPVQDLKEKDELNEEGIETFRKFHSLAI